MQPKPHQPVLQRGVIPWLAAWPGAALSGDKLRDLTGRFPISRGAADTVALGTGAAGKYLTCNPGGGAGAGNVSLTTSGMAGAVTGFPFTFHAVLQYANGHVYGPGRWGGAGADWLLARVHHTGGLVLYQADGASGTYRWWEPGPSYFADGWLRVSISMASATATPLMMINGVVVPISEPFGAGVPVTGSAASPWGVSANGGRELATVAAYEAPTDILIADMRFCSGVACSLNAMRALHNDVWRDYRPARRTLRGATTPPGHPYYYRTFVAGRAR